MTNQQKSQFISDMRQAFSLITQGTDKFAALIKRQVVLADIQDSDFTDGNSGLTAEQLNAAIAAMGEILTTMTSEQAQAIYSVV